MDAKDHLTSDDILHLEPGTRRCFLCWSIDALDDMTFLLLEVSQQKELVCPPCREREESR